MSETRLPETQETFDDAFEVKDMTGDEITAKARLIVDGLRRHEARQFVGDLFAKHGYFNGNAASFIEIKDGWANVKLVVTCYGLPNNAAVS